jgi:lysophospholipase L1-like esterase
MSKQYWIVAAVTVAVIVLLAAIELIIIATNGSTVPRPSIDRQPLTMGNGPALSYVVMGDSTAVSQGSRYMEGFAVASTAHLAGSYHVTMYNTAVSGARMADVAGNQLSEAAKLRPDLVLIAAGANDATHFTNGKAIGESLQRIVDGLRRANPQVKIIVTGSPAMDSVSRFPIGAKQLMGLRTQQVNTVVARLVAANDLSWARIAQKTRAAFLADPTLFAADKFHPNARGYALWQPVINEAIDATLTK